MLTVLVFLAAMCALAIGAALLALIVKVALLPVRLVLVLLKFLVFGAVGFVLVMVCLPLVVVLLLPLALAALVVWGTARLVFA